MDSFDLYWAEARNLTAWRVAEEKRIKSDPRLSDVGRKEELDKVREKYQQSKDDLTHRFKGEKAEAMKSHQARLNGSGKKQSFRDKVRAKALRDNSSFDMLTTESEGHFALLEGIEEMTEAIRENTFTRSIASLDPRALQARVSLALQNNDTTSLKWIRNYAESRGGEMSPLIGSIDAAINAARSPKEKLAQKCIEKLDLHEQFFMQGLQMAEKTGEMPDWRGGTQDQAVTREIQGLFKEASSSEGAES